MEAGEQPSTRVANSAMQTTITTPTEIAATGNPPQPISATHRGEKITPPMLAPLYAVDRAAGRSRSNQGDTIALMPAAPSATQPAPLNSVAAKSCQGSR